ncbi:MAG: hypothetical protein JWM19_5694 [Actinomycetia bacterium]|nr:hypothetical protein [Actinomycetes bacterium]
MPATLQQTVAEISGSLARGDGQAATAVFAEDGVLEDLTLHIEVVGRQSIAGYLGRALAYLPYGQGASVRHIVEGDSGGGYEWVNSAGPVPLDHTQPSAGPPRVPPAGQERVHTGGTVPRIRRFPPDPGHLAWLGNLPAVCGVDLQVCLGGGVPGVAGC